MIVVCGEALIDVIRGPGGEEHIAPGGGPFNTARALARLGVPAAFIGRLSYDDFGRGLAQLLTADGVSLELATIGPERTTMAVAVLDRDGRADYRFAVDGTSAPQLTAAMLPARLSTEVTALHAGSLGLALEPIASTLLELLDRERPGRLVMLDPNVRAGLAPDDEYRGRLQRAIALSTVVKASETDLAWLYPGAKYAEAAHQLRRSGVKLAVVTLGPAGAFATHRDVELTVPAAKARVVDTIAAGDVFGAALLAWLHDHGHVAPDLRLELAELQSALEYASRAAAITCSRAGADPPWKWEMTAPG